MSEIEDEKTHRSIWIRALYMLLFAVIFRVTQTIMYLTVIVGFVFRLLSSEVPDSVLSFGRDLARYLRQIVVFLTFNSELCPFPFSPWPNDHSGQGGDDNQDST